VDHEERERSFPQVAMPSDIGLVWRSARIVKLESAAGVQGYAEDEVRKEKLKEHN